MSWWLTIPTGLFGTSGSTKELLSRPGMSASVFKRRRHSIPGRVEIVCSASTLQSTGPACSDEEFDRPGASFIGRGAPRSLRN